MQDLWEVVLIVRRISSASDDYNTLASICELGGTVWDELSCTFPFEKISGTWKT